MEKVHRNERGGSVFATYTLINYHGSVARAHCAPWICRDGASTPPSYFLQCTLSHSALAYVSALTQRLTDIRVRSNEEGSASSSRSV